MESGESGANSPSLGSRLSTLDSLFRPQSVAVVGASPNPSFVSMILKNLRRYGYEGAVSAVNPKYDEVLGGPCYPTVVDVPGPLDLVIVGVAHRLIPGVLEQCERKVVGALTIVSSGFSEIGIEEGVRRQAELAAWAARTGIPICGPNCLGLMNALTGMVALPTVFEPLMPGHVGAILQSGMMAPTVLAPLLARNIGLTIAVSTGNEAVLEAADYIRFCVEDEETRVIACFTEQFKTPGRFVAACELAAERQKPIVMLKIGRSERARRAALAHTGSLVGSDAVVDAVLRKLGVTRVHSVDELHEAVAVFHSRKLPRGGGVAPISVSGGAGGLLADLAVDAGVELPPLPDETAQKLRAVVPEYGSVGNPLDITGQGVFRTEIADGALGLLAEAPNVDVVVWARGFPSRLDRQTPVGQALERAVARYPDVLFLVMALVGGHFQSGPSPDMPVDDPMDHLDGIPFLQGSQYALQAIAALIRYAEFQRRRVEVPSPPALSQRERELKLPLPLGEGRGEGTPRDQARALVHAAGGRPLTERESKAVLRLYGIPTTPEALAVSAEDAMVAAHAIGYPVALKVESPDLLHKTDAGAIVLDVGDDATLVAGFEAVLANARRAAPGAEIRGVLVQEMVDGGTEVIVGMSRDPQFGPIVACGLGGVLVETLEDVQILLPPLTAPEAHSALARLRGYPILLGTRGAGPADLDALVDVLLRFSDLCLDLGSAVSEIDVNPLIVAEAGGGARAVDALIVPSER